ncbi:DUF4440 domain-containing protein [Fulvivirgaceae bacterium BMA10]|uniref:DUF4440 domain-containing protein n=1 Tax=Splendidivirga corallicola TaxID=3051826 RepID=A0ABT8KJQ3_9BACT|nr:DUF4440 domain-containing protein [Fulvivirgaceae bacterium BMA10]
MRAFFTIALLFGIFINGHGQSEKEEILKILERQSNCWNKGDIDCFMIGYWQSDSLKFVGKNGITYGWNQTLRNYKKRYPDRATMGQLKFDILSTESLGKKHFFVVGKWHLTRETMEDAEGVFTLLWKKIKGEWVIIADHTP